MLLYSYMSDYNNTNAPEPVVTVSKPLFSKFTSLYVAVLIGTAAASWFYWQSMNKTLAPVAEEVAVVPLSEVETNIYRETLERISPETTGDVESEAIEVPETAVVDISPELVPQLIVENGQPATFIPPSTGTVVELSTLSQSDTSVTETGAGTSVAQTAYLQGDVTLLDFQIDTPDTSGTPIQLSGTVHSNDVASKSLLISSGGVIYTLKTDSASISTKDGKTVGQSNIKKDDIVTVNGTLLQSGPIIVAQTLTLIGVQEYLMDF